jgi:hypothetical protein
MVFETPWAGRLSMRWFAGVISFLTVLILLLPQVGADDNKDPAKADVKSADKKDADQKDAVKADSAKDTKKTDDKTKKNETKKEAAVVYGQTLTGELKRYDNNSAHAFVVAVPEKDPKKVYEVNMWQARESARINAIAVRNAGDVANRARQMNEFQVNLARKLNTETTTNKEMEFRLADDCKVRMKNLPVEFDLKGKPRVYTAKEIKALKGSGKLPGYTATLDQLEVGQQVTVYLAKTKTAAKGSNAKKKIADEDDEPIAKPDVVMVLILKAAPAK